MTNECKGGSFTVRLSERIDSGNAAQTEQEILSQLAGQGDVPVILDADKLEYISSAGLRILLRLQKVCADLCILNVRPEVYEILEMTGFTEIMRVDSRTIDPDCGEVSDPDELTLEAATGNLEAVIGFVNERLEKIDCPMKAQMQMDLAVEEIFVNIAHYAYAPNKGKATVRIEVSDDPVTVTITFMDRGVPYDPLQKADPDVTLGAAERAVGGLGIFLTKKVMDDVSYVYQDGQNILTLKKQL